MLSTACVCWPSQMVRGTSMLTISPRRSESCMSLPRSGSAPNTSMPGSRCLAATVVQPEEATATGADDQRIERSGILDQLQRRRALAGHHRRWSKGGISAAPRSFIETLRDGGAVFL